MRQRSGAKPPAGPLRWAARSTLFGIAAFLALYFRAAALYPGGTRFDHSARGYQPLANYWCDLLDRVSYNGAVNVGRPAALAATIVLPLSFIALWVQVPRLFPAARAAGAVVRILGPVSMLLAALVFTRWHDMMINLGALTGSVAFAVAMVALARARHWPLVILGSVALALAGANWAMWRAQAFVAAIPLVQKLAYLALLAWGVAGSVAIERALSSDD